ncbi:hypothetical protein [Sphingomonas japonica]|uniref:Lipoprotein n=1 Tax=Sphingomonas japonica TaxID=511662 RepID=A0ABX0U1L0_9SPHN|nr:hypothetical protein [Sphingomonas japonica]NIJ23584.1 hypothetical protein [Sphingomonas japonica]
MMLRLAPFACLLALAACNGGADTSEQANIAAIENQAGLDGPIVELPEEGGSEAELVGENAEAPTSAATDKWVGKWVGVEGLVLDIAPDAAKGPGAYRLTMQYTLDDKGVFEGTATPEGIAFSRPDGDHVLRATDGDATGLKYLAGKTDCLTVMQGEGYCRG